MELTEVELKMLQILGDRGPIRAAHAGHEMWDDDSAMGSSTCPHARAAGALIARLRGEDLSRIEHVGDFRHHNITGKGQKILAQIKEIG